MEETMHLRLPYIAAAQAQKHITHNEALDRIDVIVQLAVLDSSVADPPLDASEGDRYIIPEGATGDWTARNGSIAAFVAGAWDVFDPAPGWIAFDLSTESVLIRIDDGWAPLGSRLGTVTRFGVNTTADDTNRLSVRSEAVLFSAIEDDNGGSGDIRVVVSKEAEPDTASLLFQNGFSGRAELGLAGDDDFVLKVSDDGAGWVEAIRVDAASGVPTIRYDNAASGLGAATLGAAIDELAMGIREMLSADRTYHVRADGSDSNDGLSDTSGGAFVTLQKAIDVVAALDRSVHDVVIAVGAGTFSGAVVAGWGPGAGTVTINGAGAGSTTISSSW